jgi:hypothetical protein
MVCDLPLPDLGELAKANWALGVRLPAVRDHLCSLGRAEADEDRLCTALLGVWYFLGREVSARLAHDECAFLAAVESLPGGFAERYALEQLRTRVLKGIDLFSAAFAVAPGLDPAERRVSFHALVREAWTVLALVKDYVRLTGEFLDRLAAFYACAAGPCESIANR